jgi:hypothetical protein
MKISREDKIMIKAYCKWAKSKGYFPDEYEISKIIQNMNSDHRYLIEDYLKELEIKI